MDTSTIEALLAKLGTLAPDDELLACARRVPADADGLQTLRRRWPTDRWPVIGDYFCVRRLGQGASGVVFQALQFVADQPRFIALKLLQLDSREADDRFRQREIEILKALNCPHVARYLDSGVVGGAVYLAMELIEGRPLDEYLADQPRSFAEKLRVFQRLCQVVAGLHAQGVMHRDLKPRHVLVDRNGQPWVVDFGLSAVRGEDWPTRVRRAQTELGHILGTVKYMSPEQAWGGLVPIDQRADIWSLGIMLYEIATDGDYPYDLGPAGDLVGHDALLDRIQTQMPRKPRIASPAHAEALGTLIARCLAYEPAQRLDSAATLARDLDRCLAHQAIQTRGLPLAYRLHRVAVGLAAHWRAGLWLSTTAAILVLLSGVALLTALRWPTGPPASIDRVCVVGITDESLAAVPPAASTAGFAGVTDDLRTWRALHGRLMERLAAVRPSAVVWDFYFRSPQPGDPDFARGIAALDQAGVPVALAVDRYRPDGKPDLSPALLDSVGRIIRHGLIAARDMVAREGEFVLAVRRGERLYSSMFLNVAAAVRHPDSPATIDWDGTARRLRVIYHAEPGADWFPAAEVVRLTTVYRADAPVSGVEAGDLLACAAFPLHRPAEWAPRTVPYEHVWAASDDELAALASGRIVLVGDLRSSRPLAAHDRHSVRYGDETISDAPGCYLLGDALAGLLGRSYLAAGFPLSQPLFAGIVLAAVAGCLAPLRACRAKWLHNPRAQSALIAGLLAAALGLVGSVVLSGAALGVYAAMFAAAACLAAAASFAIEFARARYRLRSAGDTGRNRAPAAVSRTR